MTRIILSFLLLAMLLLPYETEALGRVLRAWWNFAHVPAFALMANAAVSAVRGQKARRLVQTAMVCLLVPGIELLQHVTGREPSWPDMLYGWAGCCAGFLWSLKDSRRQAGRIVRRAAAVCVLAASAVYPLRITADHAQLRRDFPVLAVWGGGMEQTRWELNGCFMNPEDPSVLVIEGGTPYPGAFLNDLVRDWSGARAFLAEVEVLDNHPLGMWIRMDDQRGNPTYLERFQKKYILEPGANVIRIPQVDFAKTTGGRDMNLSNIQTLGFFFEGDAEGRSVRMGAIRLDMTDSQ